MFEEFIYNLTVKENLSIPLVFIGVEEEVRDKIVRSALVSCGVDGLIDKFPHDLSEDQLCKVKEIQEKLTLQYPDLNNFIRLMKKKEARVCIPLIQQELFMNMSQALRLAVADIKEKKYDGVAKFLRRVIDRLALRISLSSVIDIPSQRILDVLILVVRQYSDFFRLREKVKKKDLLKMEKRSILDLISLAESFEEISKTRRY